MIESEGTVKLASKDIATMRRAGGGSGRVQPTAYSVKKGELQCLCQCGRMMKVGKEVLEDALGINATGANSASFGAVMEGIISEDPEAGELVFLIDNANSHNYPLATLMICGGNAPDLSALYVWTNGSLRTGNSLPTNRVFRPTRIHVDMIPDNKIMRKIVEISNIEVFGVLSKSPVVRKSSRSSKTREL